MAGIVVLTLIAVGVIALNIAYYRARARMSPRERAEFDEELRRDMQVW